jgi:RNA polymerase sigma-70 factor (ECF subfamily)
MLSTDDDDLLRWAASGDQASWARLLERHAPRLHRLVAFRMDPRLQGRVDSADVLQETYLEAWRRLADFLSQAEAPFYLWLRGIAGNKLRELHRHHLGAQRRTAGRDVSIDHGQMPEATSAVLAAQLLGRDTRPSEAAVRAEAKVRLRQALDTMEPIDREVLALRHFEQLTPKETAHVLGIKEKTAGMRYVRALRRLKTILTSVSGCSGEAWP